MILFLADNHYNNHPGKNIYDMIKDRYDITFAEDDLSPLSTPLDDVDLLMLNVIPGTPNSEMLTPEMEGDVKAYVDSGKPLLLLHGSSALLPGSDWWRELVGMRWVRGTDPWGVANSTHPKEPFDVVKTKNCHPLTDKLIEFTADDEQYIELELTSPVLPLMQSSWDGKSWAQCYIKQTPAGGKLGAFIPGHRQDIVQSEAVISNICTMIDWCLEGN